jgi:hypothetical protein
MPPAAALASPEEGRTSNRHEGKVGRSTSVTTGREGVAHPNAVRWTAGGGAKGNVESRLRCEVLEPAQENWGT